MAREDAHFTVFNKVFKEVSLAIYYALNLPSILPLHLLLLARLLLLRLLLDSFLACVVCFDSASSAIFFLSFSLLEASVSELFFPQPNAVPIIIRIKQFPINVQIILRNA